ncbi:hypothetical protein P0082_05050 [Candidatus Haliotispira prima]|uniref:Lipoprotein n=1 Tax=Candidatus Haliotispira prima TaxID=3034016 RepID=A0ABY8MLG9_9SPIO|nr:hypothetical protein P0082_05050 [Candidatus Haliotispira prima]
MSLLGCAPISNTDTPPAAEPPAPVNPIISFSSAAVASSLQLEVTSNIELANIGAVVRLAAEAAPTKTEALAGKGHVSVSIPAGVTRKISISQHYSTNFNDGLTLADVLTPNTAYKLYLYFPAGRITTTAEITGLNVTDDRAVVPFTTAALPAEGDAKWLSGNAKCVASPDTYYFMQEQTGVAVCYFYVNFSPSVSELSTQTNNKGQYGNIGTFVPNVATPGSNFHYTYGLISGYTSNSTNHYDYWVGADKVGVIQNALRVSFLDSMGIQTVVFTPVTRH